MCYFIVKKFPGFTLTKCCPSFIGIKLVTVKVPTSFITSLLTPILLLFTGQKIALSTVIKKACILFHAACSKMNGAWVIFLCAFLCYVCIICMHFITSLFKKCVLTRNGQDSVLRLFSCIKTVQSWHLCRWNDIHNRNVNQVFFYQMSFESVKYICKVLAFNTSQTYI
jgi:hypothetical protein